MYKRTWITLISWIAVVAWWASATGYMIYTVTNSIVTTRVSSTCFNAGSSAAGLAIGAIRVSWAFRFRRSATSAIWGHTPSVRTNTSDGTKRQNVDCFANQTFFTWIANTQIRASRIDACQWGRAISVCRTFGSNLCRCATTQVWITWSARWASTNWSVIFSSTNGARSTSIVWAGGLADTVEAVAKLAVVAVFVIMTYGRNASSVWVTLCSRWASTCWRMSHNLAYCITAARWSKCAWILAISIDTTLIEGTVVVRSTFRCK